MKKRTIWNIWRFLIIFLLISFIVTCNFFLFLNSMSFTKEMIQDNAIYTFFNVVLLSFIFAVLDSLQRHFTINRPVKKIVETTNQLAKGDFEARIPDLHNFYGRSEFDDIADNINHLADELSGIETLRTDFISNVSHELKTPLAVIGNYGTMLQDPEISYEKRLEYAKGITDASKRLAELITNILKLNKLENQQIYPDKKSFDLSEQLCESIINFENIWEAKNIDLDTDIEDDLIINADAELLSLVWNNLLSNAFKFTEVGGKVSVIAKKEGNYAVVSVTDSGCGLDETTGSHIFDKFYQGDSSHATQGNGLGLALVKRVIDIMEADIEVKSKVGVGSTFTVKIRRN